MPGRVEDRVALITGAGRGQGRSHALRLAEEGADIIAVDLCAEVSTTPYRMSAPEDLAETVQRVEALGRRAVGAEADVRDFPAFEKAIDEAVEELGRLDTVSANAGIGSMGALVELDEQTWQDVVDINLTGVWHTIKAAVPHIRAGGRGGAIVLTSSMSGIKGAAHTGHYAAAKHGVIGLMRTAAVELAEVGIRVNTINTTQVNTTMIHNEAVYGAFVPEKERPTRDDFVPRSQAMHLLATPWIEPIDASNAILFLASDEARFITGTTLVIDAGAGIK